ncbi:hypothetical protein DNK06_05240 [Pseudomonas daroniae]|uniref:Glycosyl transferase family 1 n=1 Tax=Phytopseudomonas daroniae TaxID=2487519 RepID=A0A4Q9QQ38_9GAMM|nr:MULTISPECIES: glycosyltransferase family 4 protein [Pseudomonas]TBU81926.1 hypothetical protein DNK06_05240 [Pseudomonas daroniae]TBU84737.1 hypothetical protein DNK31_07270 [Pseudomonas sp. FRB 228]TBU92228.1 hypothetical protein DNJ99_07385 [Pseudomonas daroniae]
MKTLHLCSYYIGSKVHRRLIEAVAASGGGDQHVWVPIRKAEHRGVNNISSPGVNVYYTKCLGIFTRLFFSWKLISLFGAFSYLSKGKGLEGVDVVHAHTLYSDGFLAYFLSKRYSVPYVLSVRSTDVNVFERALPHWRWAVRKVLAEAKYVLFISPAHKEVIEKKYQLCKSKSLFFGSAVDDYWIEHLKQQRPVCGQGRFNAIYVGDINLNKNIKSAIKGFFSLALGEKATFTVVGGDYVDYKAVYGELPGHIRERVFFFPRVTEHATICRYLADAAVLVMPSHFETFGLVYMEAISQCVPIVYSKGQGIDGLYPEGYVGFSCESRCERSIADAISRALAAFPNGLTFQDAGNPVEAFSWNRRAEFLLKRVY